MEFDASEVLVFIVSGFLLIRFLYTWYVSLFVTWLPGRDHTAELILGSVPVLPLFIIFITLITLASFDVVDSSVYIAFYIIMGYACIYAGLTSMFIFFDLSWRDDVFSLNNNAAVISISGGFIALAAIYSGANIGDGPGWWCVIFAGGLGLAAWLVLGIIVNQFTGVFERITVERDIPSGIRFGFYLLASGIILGRASAGDWTSFYMTVIEFSDGWPSLLLAALMIAIELYYIRKPDYYNVGGSYINGSVFWGIIFVLLAIVSLVLLPQLPKSTVG